MHRAHIAIVGAPLSGKTRLADELATHFPAHKICDDPDPQRLQAGDFAHILLTGLDLPGATAEHHSADALWRARLAQWGLSYGVVYGLGAQRLRAAQRLIAPQDGPPPRWTGVCEKCSDPDCEFRLFSRLQGGR